MKSFIIVGAGNFGSATALELIRKYPSASITLVDDGPFPNPRAASHDVNKIVRPDYADPLYMKIMMPAMELWRSDPLYAPYYHETGMIRADDTGFNDGCLESFKILGHSVLGGYLSVEELRKNWGGVFKNAKLEEASHCYFNPAAGWGDASSALKAVTEAAIDAGVEYCSSAVQKLIIDTNKSCKGVLLGNGEALFADNVVLCTGARTALLLAESAPKDKDIQAGNRLIATGAVSYAAKLNPAQHERYKGAPVFKNGLSDAHGRWYTWTLGMHCLTLRR
jgi:sarcosine oxidase/L-pipecolate oxidase